MTRQDSYLLEANQDSAGVWDIDCLQGSVHFSLYPVRSCVCLSDRAATRAYEARLVSSLVRSCLANSRHSSMPCGGRAPAEVEIGDAVRAHVASGRAGAGVARPCWAGAGHS